MSKFLPVPPPQKKANNWHANIPTQNRLAGWLPSPKPSAAAPPPRPATLCSSLPWLAVHELHPTRTLKKMLLPTNHPRYPEP